MELRNHNIVRIVAIGFVVLALACAGYALGQTEPTRAEREAQERHLAERRAELDRKMQEARAALNRARYEQAAELMHEVSRASHEAELAGNALYWEAFARYRMQRMDENRRAVELLKRQLA